jgi:hypothetical protein
MGIVSVKAFLGEVDRINDHMAYSPGVQDLSANVGVSRIESVYGGVSSSMGRYRDEGAGIGASDLLRWPSRIHPVDICEEERGDGGQVALLT